jgi:XTP/dITP diphosphohydrolase
MTLVFATTNKNKIQEIKDFIPKSLKILSLQDIGCNYEIEENGKSISENAWIKSSYIKTNYGYDCFADDTGLEVQALGGEPGVYSARYSEIQKSSKNNIDLLLANMKNKIDRTAKFKTCISLIIENKNTMFEGGVGGEIIFLKEKKVLDMIQFSNQMN